jgi:hypothetical protein
MPAAGNNEGQLQAMVTKKKVRIREKKASFFAADYVQECFLASKARGGVCIRN